MLARLERCNWAWAPNLCLSFSGAVAHPWFYDDLRSHKLLTLRQSVVCKYMHVLDFGRFYVYRMQPST